jgi:hypothetical protein
MTFLIFFLAGSFITGYTVYYFRNRYTLSQKSKSWPVAKGIIISETTKASDELREHSSSASTQRVKYQYIVGQRRYTATRISFFGHIRFKFMAPGKPVRYWRGQHIDVFYDPASPPTSVLQPGIHADSIAPLLVPFILGIGLMIYSFFI